MRTAIKSIIERLLTSERNEISLDEIGEVIGAMAISQAEIESIIQALEDAGRKVGEVTPNIQKHLHAVLAEARTQRAQGSIRVDSLAAATGLTVGEVRAALLYASVLSR